MWTSPGSVRWYAPAAPVHQTQAVGTQRGLGLGTPAGQTKEQFAATMTTALQLLRALRR